MPILVSCPRCQATTPLVGPIDFTRPVVCERCGAVVEDFTRETAPSAAAPVLRTSPAPPRRKEGSLLGHLLGVVTGGLAGLAVGYYLLNLLGGPQFDWLKVPLPGVPHTERHRWPRPKGMAPAATTLADAPAWTRTTDQPPTPGEVWPARERAGVAARAQDVAEPERTSATPGLQRLEGPLQLTAPPAADPRVDRIPTGFPAPGAGPIAGDNRASSTTDRAALASSAGPAAPFDLSQSPALMNPGRLEMSGQIEQAPHASPAGALQATQPATTLQELQTALADVQALLRCRVCNGVGTHADATPAADANPSSQVCRACGGRQVSSVNAEAYRQLCRLAEVATTVEAPEGEAIAAVRAAVHDLLLRLGSLRDNLQSVGRQAAYRLEQPVREQEGILLAGTVNEVGHVGALHTTRLVLFGQPRAVTIVSPRASQARPRDRLIVLGTIVTDPAATIPEFSSQETVAVWGGFKAALPPAPDRPN